MSDFYSTDAGKHLIVSAQYLEAAVTLDDAQAVKGRVLFLPTLALAGHGLELLLKACMYWNNVKPDTRGKSGHQIKNFWEHDVCEPVRGHVFNNAYAIAEEARDTGVYQGVPEGDELTLIEEYVLALAKLHGGQPYPLRYPTEQALLAPRTPWLVKVLRRTADDFLKRPDEFERERFRGHF